MNHNTKNKKNFHDINTIDASTCNSISASYAYRKESSGCVLQRIESKIAALSNLDNMLCVDTLDSIIDGIIPNVPVFVSDHVTTTFVFVVVTQIICAVEECYCFASLYYLYVIVLVFEQCLFGADLSNVIPNRDRIVDVLCLGFWKKWCLCGVVTLLHDRCRFFICLIVH